MCLRILKKLNQIQTDINNKINNKKEKVFIICGKSCAGKDTLLNILKTRYELNTLISHTTRPKREEEKDGIDYYFIKKNNFIKMINNNEFIEYKRYIPRKSNKDNKKMIWFYGTSKKEFESKDKKICVLDEEGIDALIKYYGKNNIVVIYIESKDQIREDRAKTRANFDKDQWEKRSQFDKEMFNNNFKKEKVNFIIDNNKGIPDMINQADKIMKAYDLFAKNDLQILCYDKSL